MRKLAEKDPATLAPHGALLLKLDMAEQDLRTRWNLIEILGSIPLRSTQRLIAVDWLFERLGDASPFTRTFALQALFNLSRNDEPLRRRWLPLAHEFEVNGTAAMRARARKLLQQSAG